MPKTTETTETTVRAPRPAEFVAQWRDYDDEAVRVCGDCLPKAVRSLYDDYGYTFSVEVTLLHEAAGFPCELEAD